MILICFDELQKISSQLYMRMSGYLNYLSYIMFLFILKTDKVWGVQTEHYDVATYGRRTHVYIFLRIWIFCYHFVSWLSRIGHNFSEICIRMVEEVIYILYSYVFGLYIVSLIAMTSKHNHGWHQDKIFCLFYFTRIHIFHNCTFRSKIQGYHFTQLVWCTWIIFCFFSYVVIVHLIWRWEDVGIFCNKLQAGKNGLSWVKKSSRLLIISNYKLGIGLRSQPIVDVTSQSNLYDVLTLHYTIMFPTKSTKYILALYSIYNLKEYRIVYSTRVMYD